jgi:hypothetical protein
MNDPAAKRPPKLLHREAAELREASAQSAPHITFEFDAACDPDLFHAFVALTEIDPAYVAAWKALCAALSCSDKLLDADLAAGVVRNAGAVFNETEDPEHFTLLLSAITKAVFYLDNKCDTLAAAGIVQNLDVFLTAEMGSEVVIPVNDILIAALSDFSGDPELGGIFARYHFAILDLVLYRRHQLLRTELLRTSYLILSRCDQSEEELLQMLERYVEILAQELDDQSTDQLLKCLWRLLKRAPPLRDLLVERRDIVLFLIDRLNHESLLSVKYSSKIFMPLFADPRILPELLALDVVSVIQQSIALSTQNIKYLVRALTAICETSPEGCGAIIEAGILTSAKLTGFSFNASVAMLRIYAAALRCGVRFGDDAVAQLTANVGDCLDGDDDAVIILALRVASELLASGVRCVDAEVIGGFADRANQEIAELAAAIAERLE